MKDLTHHTLIKTIVIMNVNPHKTHPTVNTRGGHTGLFLEIPHRTPDSRGLLNVEKDRKKIGYPTLEEK